MYNIFITLIQYTEFIIFELKQLLFKQTLKRQNFGFALETLGLYASIIFSIKCIVWDYIYIHNNYLHLHFRGGG